LHSILNLKTMQHQDYDKIFKENIAKVASSLVEKLCGISATNWENVSKAIPRTIERRTDWLKIGVDAYTGIKYLYHLEFQSANHPTMPMRMLVYRALFTERYGLPMRQFVIFLGEGECTMPDSLVMENLEFRYTVIAINTIDYEIFVNSNAPEEIILAILADFKGEDKPAIIRKILTNLKNKTKNQQKLDKFIFQLEILSNLRHLQQSVTIQIDSMSLNYDITKDVRFQQGIEKGELQGIEKGIDLGIEKGIDLGIEKGIDLGIEKGIDLGIEKGIVLKTHTMVMKLLRLNTMGAGEIANLVEVPLAFVLECQKEL
jgi:hypothetical protein